MEKKIQDYLHLYPTRSVFVRSAGGVAYEDKIEAIVIGESVNLKEFGDVYFEEPEACIQLILRPLSSMTGEETLTAFHMSYEDAGYRFETYSTENFGWRARNQNGMECYMPKNTFLPEVTRYLLSRGFDLFGLIESGLAIDITLHPSTIS